MNFLFFYVKKRESQIQVIQWLSNFDFGIYNFMEDSFKLKLQMPSNRIGPFIYR